MHGAYQLLPPSLLLLLVLPIPLPELQEKKGHRRCSCWQPKTFQTCRNCRQCPSDCLSASWKWARPLPPLPSPPQGDGYVHYVARPEYALVPPSRSNAYLSALQLQLGRHEPGIYVHACMHVCVCVCVCVCVLHRAYKALECMCTACRVQGLGLSD